MIEVVYKQSDGETLSCNIDPILISEESELFSREFNKAKSETITIGVSSFKHIGYFNDLCYDKHTIIPYNAIIDVLILSEEMVSPTIEKLLFERLCTIVEEEFAVSECLKIISFGNKHSKYVFRYLSMKFGVFHNKTEELGISPKNLYEIISSPYFKKPNSFDINGFAISLIRKDIAYEIILNLINPFLLETDILDSFFNILSEKELLTKYFHFNVAREIKQMEKESIVKMNNAVQKIRERNDLEKELEFIKEELNLKKKKCQELESGSMSLLKGGKSV